MQQAVLPAVPRILVARRAHDGLVYVGALVAPTERLALLTGQGVEIAEHATTRPTPHAHNVVQNLKRRFARASLAPMDGAGPWFVVEYGRMLAALGEYDLETGKRVAAEGVPLKAKVHVEGIGEGVVTGFGMCGRIEVLISRAKGVMMQTLAPAKMVTVLP